jgi:uncharacterized Zn finger protein
VAIQPKAIEDFFSEEFIEASSIPSNFAYGKAIYQRGAAEFIKREADIIEGWAGGLDGTVKEGAGQRRRVTFTIDQGELRWNCTGNPKNHQIFCKHCVALALAVKDSKLSSRT